MNKAGNAETSGRFVPEEKYIKLQDRIKEQEELYLKVVDLLAMWEKENAKLRANLKIALQDIPTNSAKIFDDDIMEQNKRLKAKLIECQEKTKFMGRITGNQFKFEGKKESGNTYIMTKTYPKERTLYIYARLEEN